MAGTSLELSLTTQLTLSYSNPKKMSTATNTKPSGLIAPAPGDTGTDITKILRKLAAAINAGTFDEGVAKQFYLEDAAISNHHLEKNAIAFKPKGIADFYKTYKEEYSALEFVSHPTLYSTENDSYVVSEGYFRTNDEGDQRQYKIVFKNGRILYHTVRYSHAEKAL